MVTSLSQATHMTSAGLELLSRDHGAVGIAPLGAFEQHGPHLPLTTDTLIADHLAQRLAAQLERPTIVLPTLPVGLSTHHLGFAGTVTLHEELIESYLDALVSTLAAVDGVALLVFSSHGGNFGFIRDYCERHESASGLRIVGYHDLGRYLTTMRDAATAAGYDVPESDIHAGGLETSQVKYLLGDDAIVVSDELEGFMTPSPGWIERLLEEGVKSVSPSGVLGRPQGATAAVGAKIFDALERELVEWATDALRDLGQTSRTSSA